MKLQPYHPQKHQSPTTELQKNEEVEEFMETEELKAVVNEALAEPVINKGAARDLFNRHGLTLTAVANQMRSLLEFGEEPTKLKVLQDLLKIHGALEQEEESKSVTVNFNFSNQTGDGTQKIAILMPR